MLVGVLYHHEQIQIVSWLEKKLSRFMTWASMHSESLNRMRKKYHSPKTYFWETHHICLMWNSKIRLELKYFVRHIKNLFWYTRYITGVKEYRSLIKKTYCLMEPKCCSRWLSKKIKWTSMSLGRWDDRQMWICERPSKEQGQSSTLNLKDEGLWLKTYINIKNYIQ